MKKRFFLIFCLTIICSSLFAYSLQGSLMEALVTDNENRVVTVIKNKPELTYFNIDQIYRKAIDSAYKENTFVELLYSSVALPSQKMYTPIYDFAFDNDYKKVYPVLEALIKNPTPYLDKQYKIDIDELVSRLSQHRANNQNEVDPFSEIGISIPGSLLSDLTISFFEDDVIFSSAISSTGSQATQVAKVISFDPFNRVMKINLADNILPIVFDSNYSILDLDQSILFRENI